MAHDCPQCGMPCHCNGDIDDCLLNFTADLANCVHCWQEETEEQGDKMISQSKSDETCTEYGIKVRRATLKEIGTWLKRQHSGVTFGDSSFTVRIYPYHLRSFDDGHMP